MQTYFLSWYVIKWSEYHDNFTVPINNTYNYSI
jgi:hypothetical protein